MAVDLKQAMAGLETALIQEKAVGYSIAAFRDGKLELSRTGGFAVVGSGAQAAKPMHPRVRLSMHSMGKTLSAAAMVHALDSRGLSVDDRIDRFLPSSWARGTGVQSLTFADVLSHRTGLPNLGDTYDAQRTMIAQGAGPPVPSYNNGAFALTRILIPRVAAGKMTKQLPWDKNKDVAYGRAYVAFVQKHVLEPCGIEGATIVYSGPAPQTRYYDPNDSSIFVEPFDLAWALANAGSGLWNLAPIEYARVIDRLRRGVLLPGIWAKMLPDPTSALPRGFGMYALPGTDGISFNHNGGFRHNSCGGFSAWVAFPEYVTVVYSVNSSKVLPAPSESLAITAYEAAVSLPVVEGIAPAG